MNKGFYARQALRKIGIRPDEYELTGDEVRDALTDLELLAKNLEGEVKLSYNIANDAENVNPAEESGTPDWADDALVYLLAVRLAPEYGKTISQDTKNQAAGSLRKLYINTDIPQIQYGRNMPVGSGNGQRFRHSFRYYRPSSNICIEGAGVLASNNGRAFPTGNITTTEVDQIPNPNPFLPQRAPAQFQAEVFGSGPSTDVALEWLWPFQDDPIEGFKIFRDGNEIEDTEDPDEFDYADISVGVGVFAYEVLAYNLVGNGPKTDPLIVDTT